MKGVTIVETETMEKLISKIDMLQDLVLSNLAELKDARKPYLNSQEVMQLLGRGNTWLNDNKEKIGFSKSTGALLFKRKDVEAFVDSEYFKA